MIDSATLKVEEKPSPSQASSAPGLRELRKQRTTLALIQKSRDFTFDRGLTGFTVDEVCQEVGVSRRTFFNYFASKEDAVLGLSLRTDSAPGAAEFLDSGRSDSASSSSHRMPLRNAIIELILADSRTAIDQDFTVDQLWELLSREPSLLARLNASAIERSQEMASLIQTREELTPHDPFALVVASLSLHLAMAAFMECSDQFAAQSPKTCSVHGRTCDKFEHYETKLRQKFDLSAQFFAM